MSETVIEAADVVQDFIDSMQWAPETPEDVRGLVAANVRGFWQFLHSERMEGCRRAIDIAFAAKWHRAAVIREIPVFVCANSFTSDPHGYGPEELWAIRRDDATVFELTTEEYDDWCGKAGESAWRDSWAD